MDSLGDRAGDQVAGNEATDDHREPFRLACGAAERAAGALGAAFQLAEAAEGRFEVGLDAYRKIEVVSHCAMLWAMDKFEREFNRDIFGDGEPEGFGTLLWVSVVLLGKSCCVFGCRPCC